MIYAIRWATDNRIIKKLNLAVLENNVAAIQLYKKNGFEVEGRLKKDFFIDEQYYDAILMGMIVE